jgi:hypothetical protein
MNPALVIVFFFWCGGGDAFCDEGHRQLIARCGNLNQ